jgi:hypothetical protein
MSKVIELSDEEYHALEEVAKKRRETPEQTLKSLVRALAEAEGAVYYSTDEMFEALDAYAAETDTAHSGQSDADE